MIITLGNGYISGQAGSKPVLAVLNLTSQNVAVGDTNIITGFIQEEFFYSGKFQLIEREQVDKLLKELQYQQSGM
jgi:hypothetical protein